MLTTLLESRAPHARIAHAQAFSIGIHLLLVAGAVAATQRITPDQPRIIDEGVRFVRPIEPVPESPATRIAAALPRGFRLLPTIIQIPSVLPRIDLSSAITIPEDFAGAGVPGGDPNGVTSSGAPSTDMTADQVDRPARLLPGSGRPSYPEALRSAGVGGEVNVQFVIDTTGRADLSTLAVLTSSHERFTEAVRRAIASARFAPAEFGGRRVRQLVRMPFVFSLTP